MRYYLIAGEASGDLHGGNLIKGLKTADPCAEFRFWGGDNMASASLSDPVVHYRDCAVMGLSDVLHKAPDLLGNLKRCKQDISLWKPDAVILIDYPGFNLKIAEFCHGAGIKVFYYIAPKTWASREGRNAKLKAYIDKLYVIFPFEVPYFTGKGIPFEYVGNPLVEEIDSHVWSRPAEEPYIALLPGSRKGEIARMMPVCMEAADQLGMNVLIAGAPSMSEQDYAPYTGSRSNVKVLFGRTYDIIKYADAAIVNSGTASLEAALIGTPQVVCWSASSLTWFVGKYVLRVFDHVKYISLANLCLDKPVFKELLQDDFNSASLASEVRYLLEDQGRRAAMQQDYARLREMLGGGGASLKAARSIIEEIKP
ncbi:MAG: lipid-A-disaccharide synthase [Bacteroidales bacterium]|nr:lipid-A-disaccharide synthase [Bacteroidales bacterium]